MSAKPHNYNNCSACRGCRSVCGCICGYKDVYVYVSVSFEGTCANIANCGHDCHMHSPQTSERVYVCVCVLLPRAVSSTTVSFSLLPNSLPPLPAPSLSTLVSSTCPFPRVTLNKRFLLAAPCCHVPSSTYLPSPPIRPFALY